MHISEGVLSAPVLITGAAVAATGVAVGLRKMDECKIPEVAVMSSAFFVASLIHVPFGPVNVHLVLNGLAGVLLGWMAFPSLLVALFLQALLFQFGGFTVLGVNTVIMALPAVAAYYIFQVAGRAGAPVLGGFLAGVAGIALGICIIGLALLGTEKSFMNVIKVLGLAHLPLALVEGAMNAFIVVFLNKVKPEMLEVSR